CPILKGGSKYLRQDSKMAKTSLRLRIETLERRRRAMSSQTTTRVSDHNFEEHARAATRDAYMWVSEHTNTYNEHWIEENRPSPYEPFPRYAYFKHIFELIEAERIIWFEKSRDMMLSWACVAYLTLEAMKTPFRGVLFQTQKEDKVIQLIRY